MSKVTSFFNNAAHAAWYKVLMPLRQPGALAVFGWLCFTTIRVIQNWKDIRDDDTPLENVYMRNYGLALFFCILIYGLPALKGLAETGVIATILIIILIFLMDRYYKIAKNWKEIRKHKKMYMSSSLNFMIVAPFLVSLIAIGLIALRIYAYIRTGM